MAVVTLCACVAHLSGVTRMDSSRWCLSEIAVWQQWSFVIEMKDDFFK